MAAMAGRMAVLLGDLRAPCLPCVGALVNESRSEVPTGLRALAGKGLVAAQMCAMS